jgi:hypothetical protein
VKKITLSFVAVSLLSACATNPDNITAAYVSPGLYNTYSCPQLREEASRVSVRAAQITGAQSSKATSDAVVMGAGLILFWPALFFLKGDGTTAAEVSRLKGEMEAVEQASIQKKCGIHFQRPENK